MNTPRDWRRPDHGEDASELTPLDVPVPPRLAETFGYRGDARLVAFYWEPVGDEVMYDDGLSAGTGEWYPFLQFCRHPKVLPELAAYDFGNSDEEARHWLVLDRFIQQFYAAPVEVARPVLECQHPPTNPLTPEKLDAIREAFMDAVRQPIKINPDEVRRHMEEQRRAIAAMLKFLDRWPR